MSSLKDIYYQNFSNYISKYKYLYLLEKNLKNSRKVICFDENVVLTISHQYYDDF